ncbi:RQC domain-containing protein, partial [Streptomyces sp. NPDC001274]
TGPAHQTADSGDRVQQGHELGAHLDLPKSVEGYYQETGRAGRDGQPSTAWMAYGLQDVVQQRKLIQGGEGDEAFRRRAASHLDAMLALCETVRCRRAQLLTYFGQVPTTTDCGNCDTCLTPPESWDGTVAAQKLLSTVVRLKRERGQKFGAGQIIDILLGRRTAKVIQFDHDQLSVFGIGEELSEAEWRGAVRQLLAQGLLAVEGEYGTLVLTEESGSVLGRQREVHLRKEAPKPASRSTKAERRTKSQAAAAELPPEAVPVFEALRAWRAAQAKEQGVPAYVIFHDATLREIAAARPDSVAALGGISGLGEKKLATYGEGVLEVLAELAEGAPLESPAPQESLAAPEPRTAPEPRAPEATPAAQEPAKSPAPRAQAQAPAPYDDAEFGWDEEPPEYA